MSHTPSISERQDDPMSWLFGELYGKFGNAFLDKFRSGHVVADAQGVECDTGIENMKAVWAESIREHRMNFSEVRRGLRGCDRLRFPPSWPEFFALCRPVPTVDDAIREAVVQIPLRVDGKDQWSHPAIYWAAVKVGFHDVSTQDSKVLQKRFDIALASVLAGEVLPVPPARVLPALPPPVVSQEEIEAAKRDIAEASNRAVKSASDGSDHLLWARKIAERVRQGDKSVTLYCMREAQIALGERQVRGG